MTLAVGVGALRLAALAALVASLASFAHATTPPIAGALPPEVRQALEEGRLTPAVRAAAADDSAFSVSSAEEAGFTLGTWRIPVLLTSFTDVPERFPADPFRTLLFDTLGALPHGSLSEYYWDVSYGRLRVTGEVFGWFPLSQDKNFYAADSYGLRRLGAPRNIAGLVQHAVEAADPLVDFSRYDRDGDGEVDFLLVVHTGLGAEATPSDRTNLWSVTSSLASNWDGVVPYVTEDPRPGSPNAFIKVNRFAILPELSSVTLNALTEIGTYCHELGHGLGWPDLYDATSLGGGSNLGPGNWCLMSTGSFGGDSRSPERPTRPSAWALRDAGWATVENLDASEFRNFEPVDENGRIYRLWWQGDVSSEFLLLENRVRRGYDAILPGEGLLVHRVEEEVIAASRGANRINSGFIPGLRLEEADGIYHLRSSINRADGGDPFPGSEETRRFADDTQPSARTYSGRYTNLLLSEIERIGDEVRAWVQVTPTGWTAPQSTPVPGDLRLGPGRSLRRLGSDLHLIYEDFAEGGTVWALRRAFDVAWSSPQSISAMAGATDPAWTDGQSGPLTALWTDRRHGNPEIYYRVWQPSAGEVRRATHSPGSLSTRPGGAWLPDGTLLLLWLDTRLGGNQLFTKRLTPGFEPDSTSRQISDPSLTLEIIEFSLAADAQGAVFVAYTARTPEVDEIFWLFRHPVNGWTEVGRLSSPDGFPSGSPAVSRMADGNFRIVWRDNDATRTRIRTRIFDPVLEDFLVSQSDLFRTPLPLSLLELASGPGLEAGVLTRASEPPLDRVLFAGRHGDGSWDVGLGGISDGVDAGGGQLALDYDEEGLITAVWTSREGGVSRVVTRRRTTPSASLVDVPRVVPGRTPGARARAEPNPATGTVRFRFESPVPAGARLTLYAPTGRRVRRLAPDQAERGWRGLDEGGNRLPPGLYLYRLESPGGRPLGPAGKLVWIP